LTKDTSGPLGASLSDSWNLLRHQVSAGLAQPALDRHSAFFHATTIPGSFAAAPPAWQARPRLWLRLMT
jgi:hypothetical protein